MGFFSNVFKKDEDERKAAYQPSSDATQAVEAKGSGKASGKNIEKPKGGFTDAQQKRITRSRTDSGWGYYDPNTGNYVPWYIDIQDGGGKNQSGDTFQGAGLYSALLNAADVAPYGYNRPRTYARSGMAGRPELPQPPAPIDGAVSTPDRITAPTQNFSNLSNAAAIRSGLVGYSTQVVAGTLPAPAPNIDVGFDDFPAVTNESFVATPTVDEVRQRALQVYGPKFNELLPQTQEQIIARMQAIMAQR